MWSHFALVCRYDSNSFVQMLQVFINGKEVFAEEKPINLRKRISFIGNSKDGNEPFGTVADLRIFPFAIKSTKIERLSGSTDAR